MIAAPCNPAPMPHPPPLRRHCTVSMLVGAAFLMARASAIGVADATFANVAMLTANNAVAARIGTRFVIGGFSVTLRPVLLFGMVTREGRRRSGKGAPWVASCIT